MELLLENKTEEIIKAQVRILEFGGKEICQLLQIVCETIAIGDFINDSNLEYTISQAKSKIQYD